MIATLISAVLGVLVGGAAGYWFRHSVAAKATGSLEAKAKTKLEEAETKSKSLIIEAKDKASSIIAETEKEERQRKNRISELETRLLEREDSFDKKLTVLGEQETTLRTRTETIQNRESKLAESESQIHAKLESVARLSVDEARTKIIEEAKVNYRDDLAASLQKLTKERQDDLERHAVEIMTTSLQRYARGHVSEFTTSTFPLADEDLKGKIIGREGRNIRSLERATGVELLMDEVPDAIIISSFDPLRREIARMALEKLIKDGRIQPAKIEEEVEEAKAELAKRVLEIGEAAAQDVGVYDLPKELLQLLGRLHFRTSFGQNVLIHSTEMAHIAAMMAGELGLNVNVTRKGALLHDIGKAIDHEVEGTHVDLGRKILKKFGVDDAIIEAMQSHHEDYPYARPEAYVVTAADVLSAARPGARRGTVENYIKRLADLERIAMDFPGVKQAYAISAGRELRVFVIPEKIDDFRALEMAREIANRVQSELKFPGEIKVNVIREMRAVEYAR